jgi:hypothetical protein
MTRICVCILTSAWLAAAPAPASADDLRAQLARMHQRLSSDLDRTLAERAHAAVERSRMERRRALVDAAAELAIWLGRLRAGDAPPEVWQRIADTAARIRAAAGVLAVEGEG